MTSSQRGNGFYSTKNTLGTNPFYDGTFDSITVNGPATVTGSASVGNTLTVGGATTLASSLSVAGLSTFDSIDVTNDATIGGTLDVTGDTTLVGLTADSGGFNSLFTNTLSVVSNVVVTGNVTVTGESVFCACWSEATAAWLTLYLATLPS